MARRTRREIYPDTRTFKFKNVNPKNRVTGDCVFRAFANAMEQDYNETVMEMAMLMCKTGYAMNDKKGEEAYLKSKGWIKCKQPRKLDNTKYTGEEFCRMLQGEQIYWMDGELLKSDRIVAHIGGHHMVAIINGKVEDIWDSTDGTIGNYWIKK